jgi:hypothetical protein
VVEAEEDAEDVAMAIAMNMRYHNTSVVR